MKRDRGDRGSAVVEFSLVLVPLVLTFLAVVQTAMYLHVRNVLTASAAEGARYGANADVPTTAAGPRTLEIAATALSTRTVSAITCSATDTTGPSGLRVVRVSCAGEVPTVLPVLGAFLPLRVQARALEESA